MRQLRIESNGAFTRYNGLGGFACETEYCSKPIPRDWVFWQPNYYFL